MLAASLGERAIYYHAVENRHLAKILSGAGTEGFIGLGRRKVELSFVTQR